MLRNRKKHIDSRGKANTKRNKNKIPQLAKKFQSTMDLLITFVLLIGFLCDCQGKKAFVANRPFPLVEIDSLTNRLGLSVEFFHTLYLFRLLYLT